MIKINEKINKSPKYRYEFTNKQRLIQFFIPASQNSLVDKGSRVLSAFSGRWIFKPFEYVAKSSKNLVEGRSIGSRFYFRDISPSPSSPCSIPAANVIFPVRARQKFKYRARNGAGQGGGRRGIASICK